MLVVEVDVLRPEAPQRRVEGPTHMLRPAIKANPAAEFPVVSRDQAPDHQWLVEVIHPADQLVDGRQADCLCQDFGWLFNGIGQPLPHVKCWQRGNMAVLNASAEDGEFALLPAGRRRKGLTNKRGEGNAFIGNDGSPGIL